MRGEYVNFDNLFNNDEKKIINIVEEYRKHLLEYLSENPEVDKNKLLADVLDYNNKIEYIDSGAMTSDVFSIGQDFVFKVVSEYNENLPESKWIAKPLLQGSINGQRIEIYEKLEQIEDKEMLQKGKYYVMKALQREGMRIDDTNNGFIMLNPRTGYIQVVDNDSLEITKLNQEEAIKTYDEEVIKLAEKNETIEDEWAIVKRPSIEEIEYETFFPELITKQNNRLDNYDTLKVYLKYKSEIMNDALLEEVQEEYYDDEEWIDFDLWDDDEIDIENIENSTLTQTIDNINDEVKYLNSREKQKENSNETKIQEMGDEMVD